MVRTRSVSHSWNSLFESHSDFVLTTKTELRWSLAEDVSIEAHASVMAPSLLPVLRCLPEASVTSLVLPSLSLPDFQFILESFPLLRSLEVGMVSDVFFEVLASRESEMNWKHVSQHLTRFVIRHLKFSLSPERDLAFISKFRNLRALRLVNKTRSYTELEHLDFLTPLVLLEELLLENINVLPTAPLNFISRISNLRSLNMLLSGENLSLLAPLENLESLTLYSVDTAALDLLQKLPCLSSLDVSPCSPDLTPESIQLLSSLKRLRRVYIDDRTFLSAEESVQLLYPLISRSDLQVISKQFFLPPSRSWLSPIAPRGPYTGGLGRQEFGLHWSLISKTVVGH
jgi:hypothetical protein